MEIVKKRTEKNSLFENKNKALYHLGQHWNPLLNLSWLEILTQLLQLTENRFVIKLQNLQNTSKIVYFSDKGFE